MMADQAKQEARLAVCAGCEFKKTLVKMDVCGACGCPLRNKVKFERASCPKKKW